MDFYTIAGRMLSLFFIMLIGYIMRKAKVIDEAANVRFTKLVLNITVPAQVLTAFLTNRGIMGTGELLLNFALSAAVFGVYGVLAVLFLMLTKVPKKQRGTYAFMAMFSNVGFMGYPVITAVFGSQAMIYAVILNVVFNLVVYSAGIFMIGGGSGTFRFRPGVLFNIPLGASLISILLYFTSITFPAPVMESLNYLGNVTTPVAMLVLGSTIASMPVKELFDDWRIYLFTAFRLLVIPFVIYFLLKPVGPAADLMKGTLIILSAMPVATNSTMLAIEYHGDVRLASKGVFFSTILSVLTIPFMAMLCR